MEPIIVWKILNIINSDNLILITYSIEVEDNNKKASTVNVYTISNDDDRTAFNSLTEEEKIQWIKQHTDSSIEDKLIDSLYN